MCSSDLYSSKFNSEKTYTEAVRYNFPITSFTKFDLYTYAMDQINAYYDDGWGTKYKPTTGDGSSGNPYLIETAWNLAWVKAITTNNTNYNNPDVYYKLTTNIYISDTLSWKPIGQTSEFKANFDGGGNEIINMIITDKYSHVGLFGFTNGATISNLIAKGSITAVTSGGSFFGGIIGQATNTTISNCNNYVDMSNPQGGSTGGIIGQGLGSVVIKDCNNYGVINGYEFTGGIIGQYNSYESGALITGCNNFNFITGSRKEIGGIVGFANSNQLPINYCSNYGNVTGTSQASDIGGIVGSGYANTITYCYNSVTLTGYTYTGTIIGDNLCGTLSNTNANTGLANGTGSMVGTH